MALFIGCQAKCVDLALTSGASNNYGNMMGVIFNSARCVFKCMCISACGTGGVFWQVPALLGATVQSALMDFQWGVS